MSELNNLNPLVFEHLVNFIALKVLGAGASGFGPGADGGRDGIFNGEAPYPSSIERWSGVWHIQSKFHAPHLSKDPSKWLLSRIEEEIAKYNKYGSDRKWPQNWIIATNIDPSGKPETGAYDKAFKLVSSATKNKNLNFHIWGGSKILQFIAGIPEISSYYGHFLTPGHVIGALYNQLAVDRGTVTQLIRHLVVDQFANQLYTKLDQAGSSTDSKPGIHQLFVDLPFESEKKEEHGFILKLLLSAGGQCQKYSARAAYPEGWRRWLGQSQRARALTIKGGPGQGKSTICQYFCQIQRASLILQDELGLVHDEVKRLAKEVGEKSNVQFTEEGSSIASATFRIPVVVELRDYAYWFGEEKDDQAKGILTYLSKKITHQVEQKISVGLIRQALQLRSWVLIFDGLDEVPNDVKDQVAAEIVKFVNSTLVELDSDALTICTSRPQGYSGQFEKIDGPSVNLTELTPEIALKCAEPIVALGRSTDEAQQAMTVLKTAITSPGVKELMTTPLQSHIMAVIVRDGSRPPERKWKLFDNFYQIMRKRENSKDFPDQRISKLLREDERLLRSIHNRLGFVLHARAESSEGAQTKLPREEFRHLATQAVSKLKDKDIHLVVDTLMEATTERLVLVSTPESGAEVRFDIRQLQEFFAAEFIYDGVPTEDLQMRLQTIAGDAHWREVTLFVLSALVEANRSTDFSVATDVLNSLHFDSNSEIAAAYKKKLAQGALLVARLLQEGVLEQDKRTRNQLAHVLRPILGLVEPHTLELLVNIRSEDSRSWFISFLQEALSTDAVNESFGTAYLLGRILRPTDVCDENSIMHWFKATPIDFQSKLYQAWDISQYSSEGDIKQCSGWVFTAAISTLVDPRWKDFGNGGLLAILSFLKSRHASALTHARAVLSLEEFRLFQLLVEMEKDEPEEREELEKMEVGIYDFYFYPNDWSNQTVPADIEALKAHEGQTAYTGVLHYLKRILSHTGASDRCSSESKELLSRDDLMLAELLPDRVRAMLPMYRGPDGYASLSELKLQIEDNKILEEYRPVKKIQMHSKGMTKENFLRCLKHRPSLAFLFYFSPHHGEGFSLELKEQLKPDISDFLIANPKMTQSSFFILGNFVRDFPNFRPAIHDHLQGKPFIDRYRIDDDYEISPFTLSFPDELGYLPNFCARLACIPSYVHDEFRDGKNIHNLARIIDLYGVDPEYLHKISQDEVHTPEIRGAASIIFLFSTLGNEKGTSEKKIIIAARVIAELSRLISSEWFVFSVVKYLTESQGAFDTELQHLLVELMKNNHDDIVQREILHTVLQSWRERSTAPVTKGQSLKQWLDA